MFKLALSAGHWINEPGKRCMKAIDANETREWVLNDRICDKVEAKLKEYDGIQLLRVDDTTGATNVSLDSRAYKANTWGADFYLSVHHNAGIKGGTGGGISAYVYTKVDANTKDWQKKLYDTLIKHTGLKGNRATPLASANLYECRKTAMACVLLELGFMDSKVDVPIILTEAFAEKCANAIVETIVTKAGLKKKATNSSALERSMYEAEIKKLQAQIKTLENKVAITEDKLAQIKAIVS